MSNLVICNHCQELFKEENTTCGEVKGYWMESQEGHLCDKCKEELDGWLNPEEAKILKEYIKGDKNGKKDNK